MKVSVAVTGTSAELEAPISGELFRLIAVNSEYSSAIVRSRRVPVACVW